MSKIKPSWWDEFVAFAVNDMEKIILLTAAEL